MSWISPESRFIWNRENSQNQISLSIWGIPTLATAEEERDGSSCHGDRVALWGSPVTGEVTQNSFKKINAQFCPFTMPIEEHLDLNQLFEGPLLEAFRYSISFSSCRRKRPMKTGSLNNFTQTHTFWKKSLHQKFNKAKYNGAISL